MNSNESVEDDFIDLLKLNELDSNVITNLTQVTIAFVINPSNAIEFHEKIDEIATTVRIKPAALKLIAKSLIIYYLEAIKKGQDSEIMRIDLLKIGLLENTTNKIIDAWSSKHSTLNSKVIDKSSSSNRLIDLDWCFGVTASSDESDQIGSTFLQMKLATLSDETGVIKEEFMELSLENFYQFLIQMEKCKAYVDLISS
mmetsp:Transcript_11928/g.10791  ORF Transcript_11928/g.10791 Transcript_11928/m.10791 type:complete len:199 (-) Transcript_11928:77-673(-)